MPFCIVRIYLENEFSSSPLTNLVEPFEGCYITDQRIFRVVSAQTIRKVFKRNFAQGAKKIVAAYSANNLECARMCDLYLRCSLRRPEALPGDCRCFAYLPVQCPLRLPTWVGRWHELQWRAVERERRRLEVNSPLRRRREEAAEAEWADSLEEEEKEKIVALQLKPERPDAENSRRQTHNRE